MVFNVSYRLTQTRVRRIAKFNVTGTEYRLKIDPFPGEQTFQETYDALNDVFRSEYTDVRIRDRETERERE